MRLDELDKNVKVTDVNKPDIKLYSVREEPFEIYGLYNPKEKGDFKRMPEDVARAASKNVEIMNHMTSGARVRFKTDSEYVMLKAVLPSLWLVDCMPITSSSGFDMYVDGEFKAKFGIKVSDAGKAGAKFEIDGGYESIIEFGEKKMRDIIINFPLYNAVSDVYIGLEEDAKLEKGNKYKHDLPVVFYGSSITTGGFASRPGNSYPAVVSKRLDTDFLNLGFPGSALAEKALAEYIADIPMSVFVFDYDCNAPSPEFLEKTHQVFYKIVREKNPDLPIIFASYIGLSWSEEELAKRIEIIKKTYEDAKNSGDENVYFINGQEILKSYDKDMFTVDGTHPNDFGFFCMAEGFQKVIEPLLK